MCHPHHSQDLPVCKLPKLLVSISIVLRSFFSFPYFDFYLLYHEGFNNGEAIKQY